jgi:hypothetical protein
MVYSEVQICNLAMSHIGAYPISSLDESTKEARECKQLYPITRDMVLASARWSFAIKRKALGLLDETQDPWAYAYQYPAGCLQFLGMANTTINSEIYQDYTPIPWEPFEVDMNEANTGKRILTNREDAIGLYIMAVTNTSLFSMDFINALAYRLAADLAIPLKADIQLMQSLESKYYVALNTAKVKDAQEVQETPSTANAFLASRL